MNATGVALATMGSPRRCADALLRGIKTQGPHTITHSILMRAKSKTVRLIRALHDLQNKTIRLRSDSREHSI